MSLHVLCLDQSMVISSKAFKCNTNMLAFTLLSKQCIKISGQLFVDFFLKIFLTNPAKGLNLKPIRRSGETFSFTVGNG